MKKYFLPFLILFCALGLSSTAAFYSITGLSLLFAATRIPVIIMASFLELSKITIATLLHRYWKSISIYLKTYLISALFILMVITSAGVYGLLSSGYQTISNKSIIIEQELSLIDKQQKLNETSQKLNTKQLFEIQQSISKLRENLGNNIQTTKDKKGNILTTSSSGNRKSYEKQLDLALKDEKQIKKQLSSQDSIILDLTNKKFEIESKNTKSNELGPLKYLSNLTHQPMDVVINWLLLAIIFVFDPLAIVLIISASFAFNQIQKKPEDILIQEEVIGTPLPEVTPENINEEKIDEGDGIIKTPFEYKYDPNLSAWRNKKQQQELEGEIKTY